MAESARPSVERLARIVEAGAALLEAFDALKLPTANPSAKVVGYRNARVAAVVMDESLGGRDGDDEIRDPSPNWPEYVKAALRGVALQFASLADGWDLWLLIPGEPGQPPIRG